MVTTTRSIDRAAAGYIPLGFVRALSASIVVAAVFGIAALTAVASVEAVAQGGVQAALVAPLGVALVLLLIFTPVVLVVAILGAAINLVHRRILGLLLLVVGLAGVIFLVAGFIYSIGAIAGLDMTTAADPTPPPRDESIGLAAFTLIGSAISFELARAGWWQLVTSAEAFRAVRGWRPPPWQLLTSFRRYLGLPSFLSYVGKKRRTVSLLYFGVAVLNLGLLMVLLLPMFLGFAPDATEDFNPIMLYVAMGGLLALNLFGVGALLARLADARATKLYQNVREWDERPPIVFLRAFDQDASKLRARGGDAFARWPAGVGRARTLDEVLLEHGSVYGPVIAIGDPRDPTPPLGAARVFVEGADSAWQEVVRSLAGASRAVVMCPNHGEGVQWELDLIAQAGGRLHTIILASPELDRAESLALFQRLVPEMPTILPKQAPLAAFQRDGAWRVLTAKRLSVDTYTVALNSALHGLFGPAGIPLRKAPPRARV